MVFAEVEKEPATIRDVDDLLGVLVTDDRETPGAACELDEIRARPGLDFGRKLYFAFEEILIGELDVQLLDDRIFAPQALVAESFDDRHAFFFHRRVAV